MPPFSHGNKKRSGEVSDLTLWRWMFNYLKEYKKSFIVLSFLLLIFTIISALLPNIQQMAIDKGIRNNSINILIKFSIEFLILLIISFVGSIFVNYYLGKLGSIIVHDIRLDLLKNIQNMSMNYFETHNIGDIISVATNDVDQLNLVFGGQLAFMFVNIFKAIFIVFLMFRLNIEITILILLIIPLLMIFITFLQRSLKASFKITRKKISKVTQISEQNISGIKVIKSYGRESLSNKEFNIANKENREISFTTGKIMGVFFSLITFLIYFFMSILLLYGGYGLLNNGITLFGGSITIGQLSAFNSYIIQLLFPIMSLLMFKQISDNATASAERIYKILNEKNSIIESSNPKKIDNIKGFIEFKNVRFKYKKNRLNIKKNINVMLNELMPFEKKFILKLINNLNYNKKLLFVERFIKLSFDERDFFIKKLKLIKNKDKILNEFTQEFNNNLNYLTLSNILNKRLKDKYVNYRLNNDFNIELIDDFIQQKELSNTQILELLLNKKLNKKQLGEISLNVRNALKEYERINKKKKEYVLKDINLKIPQEKTIAFVGETGAGKSTLIKLLARFYDVDSGEILIDNINIKEFKVKDLRKIIGMVPQDSFLFSDSIINNIYYGTNKKPIINSELLKITKNLGIHKFIENLPNKYFTKIKKEGSNLSVGQRQLICFARVLLTNPKILILDEATSSIDPYNEKLIQKAIKKISKNRTTIIIAHRLSTIKDADIICVIDNGKIIESGTHNELMKLKGHYFELINIQKNKK